MRTEHFVILLCTVDHRGLNRSLDMLVMTNIFGLTSYVLMECPLCALCIQSLHLRIKHILLMNQPLWQYTKEKKFLRQEIHYPKLMPN